VIVPEGWTLTTGASNVFAVTLANGQVVMPDIGLRSPDTVAPRVEQVTYDRAAGGFRIRFSEDVSATLDPSDFFVRQVPDQQGIPSSQYRMEYDHATQTALLRFVDPAPAFGHFALLVRGGTYFDPSGNAGLAYGKTLSIVEADINADGAVDFSDLLILAQNMGRFGDLSRGNLNDDNLVDFDDLLILAQHYRPMPTPPAIAKRAKP
jgi:hypothetical protein